METTSNLEFKVGLFIAVGILLSCISILLLGGDRMLFKRQYRLTTQMSQVTGLSEGSVVSLAGLNIGNVESIDFSPEQNALSVTLKIDQKFQERIREGSTAEVKTQGALGDKFVYINPAPLSGKMLADGDALIASEGGDLLSIISGKGDSFAQIFEVIAELNLLLKTINGGGRSHSIMTNLAATTNALRDSVQKVNALLTDIQGDQKTAGLKKSLQHLGSVLEKLDRGDGTLGALINDPSLHDALKAIVGASPRQEYLKGFVREAIQTKEKAR